jgi:hypothetical protein
LILRVIILSSYMSNIEVKSTKDNDISSKIK